MRLDKVRAQKKRLSLAFGDETLSFEYYPNIYTPEHEEVQQRALSETSAGAMLKGMLVPLIASWDLQDEIEVDGEKKIVDVPISEDGLQNIPIPVLVEIFTAINKDLSPEKPTGSDSSGSF